MTNEQILELAKQCGFDTRDGFDGPLITFALAVAQAALLKQAKWALSEYGEPVAAVSRVIAAIEQWEKLMLILDAAMEAKP